MDIRLMLRTTLAVLLVLLWVFLPGVDVLEDLDLPSETEVHSSTDVPLPGFGQIGKLVNNIDESADYSRLRGSSFLQQAAVQLSFAAPTVFQKSSKLHKLHHIFLI
jgi:hypothetical protein